MTPADNLKLVIANNPSENWFHKFKSVSIVDGLAWNVGRSFDLQSTVNTTVGSAMEALVANVVKGDGYRVIATTNQGSALSGVLKQRKYLWRLHPNGAYTFIELGVNYHALNDIPYTGHVYAVSDMEPDIKAIDDLVLGSVTK